MNAMPVSFHAETIAAFLEGEQLIAIFLAVAFAVIAGLSLCSWFIVRRLKPRIGRRAYLAAAGPFALLATAIALETWRESPNEGQPSVLPASKLTNRIKSLPDYAHFSISGLAFFKGKLYAGTGLGLLELSGAMPSQLYEFESGYTPVSGPWLDRANHLLWALDEGADALLRFDGNTWVRMPKPTPAKGYYTRGDVGEGIRPIGNDHGFWMTTAGTAWKWDATNSKWLRIAGYVHDPKNPKMDQVIGVLPIGQTPLLLVRHELFPFLIKPDEDFSSDEIVIAPNAADQTIPRDGKPFLADTWAVDRDSGYICTTEHLLIKVTKDHVAPLAAPGPCETVATAEDLSLLASIQGKGVFRYAQGQWSLILASPYPSGAGEYWTHLAAQPGQVALALDGKPVIDHEHSSGSDMRFMQNAPTGLWVSEKDKFVPVKF